MPYLNYKESDFACDLRTEARGGRRQTQLIWGDFIHDTGNRSNGFAEVRARGTNGWIPADRLADDGLLEFYVIDVGQGDGVLIRTPDDRWHLIDAGVSNRLQMTGKGAANFIRWKFNVDLGAPANLASVVLSHPDFDHYGGLINLLSGDLEDGEAPFEVSVDAFYHGGMGRFDSGRPLGDFQSGKVAAFPIGGFGIRRQDSFITELLDNKASFANPGQPFDDHFAALAGLIDSQTTAAKRLGIEGGIPGWLPGYSDQDQVTGPQNTPFSIRLLGPVVEQFEDDEGIGRLGLRRLASDSKTRNGHSVILRFDYGDARILMTGDLNDESQRLLLSYLPTEEFAVDVAKGCHHGSEDVSLKFIEAMAARATVISSGDNESYAHPRPVVLGASAHYGRPSVAADDGFLPPLVYSTELARSVRLCQVDRVRVNHDGDTGTEMRSYAADQAEVRPEGRKYRHFSSTPVATDLIYGLVNVRTDGKRILCATMKESGKEFDAKVFMAGRAPA